MKRIVLPGEREKPTLESAYFPPRTQFFFPVGRSYILTGRMEHGPDRTGRATPRMMKDMRRFQVFRAHKEIYAPFKSDELREENDKMSAGKRIVVPDLPDEWFVV